MWSTFSICEISLDFLPLFFYHSATCILTIGFRFNSFFRKGREMPINSPLFYYSHRITSASITRPRSLTVFVHSTCSRLEPRTMYSGAKWRGTLSIVSRLDLSTSASIFTRVCEIRGDPGRHTMRYTRIEQNYGCLTRISREIIEARVIITTRRTPGCSI